MTSLYGLTPDGDAMAMTWMLQARDEQLGPDTGSHCTRCWPRWWLRAGRGAGKTYTGSQWMAGRARANPGTRWAVVAPTQGDCRDICFEGESGLLSVFAHDEILRWSRVELTLELINGSRIKGYSSEKPDRLRGPEHHGAWFDELSSWNYAERTYDMAEFGLRLPLAKRCPECGDVPPVQVVITSTPKRNSATKMLTEEVDAGRCLLTSGSTYDNRDNLSDSFVERVVEKYEGTSLGRQELYGDVLDDEEGAMWRTSWLQYTDYPAPEDVVSAVVGWDPATTSKDKSDAHGVVGMVRTTGGDLVVMADRSVRGTPEEGASAALELAADIGARQVVCEDNQGGETWDVVWGAVCDAAGVDRVDRPKLKRVSAKGSKEERATPLALLYEQAHNGVEGSQRVFHARGVDLDALHDEMCTWVPTHTTRSPNRIDALVWAAYGLGVRATSRKGARRSGSFFDALNA